MSKILFILSIFLGTFSFSNELNEIRITSENYSLFENIIKVDLDKNTKLFKIKENDCSRDRIPFEYFLIIFICVV